ncbi:MAG TPA: GWxTD domain-containing protein [bacterium]|nr:GWxTD domain-containing protein [bacterium]
MSVKTVLLYGCFMFAYASSPAQGRHFEIIGRSGTPSYYFDIVTTASEDSGLTHVGIYVKVAHDQLQFIRTEENAYSARYELDVTVLNGKNEQVDRRVIEKSVRVFAFEETHAADRMDLAEADFRINPGEYSLVMSLTDQDSRQMSRHRLDLKVLDYREHDLSMSDILLADTVTADSERRLKAMPNVTWEFTMDRKQLFLVLDLFSTQDWESIPLQMKLIGDNKTVRHITEQIQRKGFRSPVILRLPREGLQPGLYRIEILVGRDKHIDRRIKNLTVRWPDMPGYALDLDAAIEQLRHIAKPGDIRKMKRSEGDEKRRLFLEFWDSVDPTPGTATNELMETYYTRVHYANRHFGNRREGWNTDRGMVYIRLGAPDDVERHPFDMHTRPYEIWIYYHLSRRFVFVDDTGFGDYRLVTPVWDEWYRR